MDEDDFTDEELRQLAMADAPSESPDAYIAAELAKQLLAERREPRWVRRRGEQTGPWQRLEPRIEYAGGDAGHEYWDFVVLGKVVAELHFNNNTAWLERDGGGDMVRLPLRGSDE